MFRRKPDKRDEQTAYLELVMANQSEQIASLHAQLVAASAEAERRLDAMQRDRDYWREQAKGSEL